MVENLFSAGILGPLGEFAACGHDVVVALRTQGAHVRSSIEYLDRGIRTAHSPRSIVGR